VGCWLGGVFVVGGGGVVWGGFWLLVWGGVFFVWGGCGGFVVLGVCFRVGGGGVGGVFRGGGGGCVCVLVGWVVCCFGWFVWLRKEGFCGGVFWFVGLVCVGVWFLGGFLLLFGFKNKTLEGKNGGLPRELSADRVEFAAPQSFGT